MPSPSVIDYLQLDANFPIAGVDNPSKGFRDNFAIIKNALSQANTELVRLGALMEDGIPSALTDLVDVTGSPPAEHQALLVNPDGTSFSFDYISLNILSEVVIGATGNPLLNGQALRYNSVSRKWENSSYVGLDAYSTDDLVEGANPNRKYLNPINFKREFDNLYYSLPLELKDQRAQDSICIPAIKDTVSPTVSALLVDNSLLSSFVNNQMLRIYGASLATDDILLSDVPSINPVGTEKVGFTGGGLYTFSYKIAEFNPANGKISAASVAVDIADIDPTDFSLTNNITLVLTPSNIAYGVLIYRQVTITGGGDDAYTTSTYNLIDVVSPDNASTYTDYFSFSRPSWSPTNSVRNDYTATSGVIHFPIIAPVAAQHGWANVSITSPIGAVRAVSSISITGSNYINGESVSITSVNSIGAGAVGVAEVVNGTLVGVSTITNPGSDFIEGELVHITSVSGTGANARGIVTLASGANTIMYLGSVYCKIDFNTSLVVEAGTSLVTPKIWISHDDTAFIQSCINAKAAQNMNSLILGGKRYIISQLSLPPNFALTGIPGQSILQKLSWSSPTSNTMIKAASPPAVNIALVSISIDGNIQNQYVVKDDTLATQTDNYAIALSGTYNNCENVRVFNTIGGAYAAPSSSILINTHNLFENGGGNTTVFASPLFLEDCSEISITNNVMRNYTGAINVSASDIGVMNGNIVNECGVGIDAVAVTQFVIEPNVIVGGIQGPNVFDSIYDSVNIRILPNTTFTSDLYQYTVNGAPVDLRSSNDRSSLEFIVNTLRKQNNVEELSVTEVLVTDPVLGPSKPIQMGGDDSLATGEYNFLIPSAYVNLLKSEFSYKTLAPLDVDINGNTYYQGLIYSVILKKYIPVGTVVAAALSSMAGRYIVDIDYLAPIPTHSALISERSSIRFLSHIGGSPDLNTAVGIIETIEHLMDDRDRVTIAYFDNAGDPITLSIAGNDGTLTVEDSTVIATGKIL